MRRPALPVALARQWPLALARREAWSIRATRGHRPSPWSEGLPRLWMTVTAVLPGWWALRTPPVRSRRWAPVRLWTPPGVPRLRCPLGLAAALLVAPAAGLLPDAADFVGLVGGPLARPAQRGRPLSAAGILLLPVRWPPGERLVELRQDPAEPTPDVRKLLLGALGDKVQLLCLLCRGSRVLWRGLLAVHPQGADLRRFLYALQRP
mmetsp:Transcript_108916/g.325761  ORF Transcript_108916/g.325761 Transcript_108916/m.325761 type:complete len:207 (-) Transcript_108916:385-1005(-)